MNWVLSLLMVVMSCSVLLSTRDSCATACAREPVAFQVGSDAPYDVLPATKNAPTKAEENREIAAYSIADAARLPVVPVLPMSPVLPVVPMAIAELGNRPAESDRHVLALPGVSLSRTNTESEEDGIEGTGNSSTPVDEGSGIEGTGITHENDIAEDGIEGTGITDESNTLIAMGTITRFGSIFVNGEEYEIDNATLEMGQRNLAQGDSLRLGMYVTVEVDLASQPGGLLQAKQVIYDQWLEGAISSVHRTDDALTADVNGYTVIIDEDTFIDGTTLATLDKEQVIAVSGSPVDDRTLHATYVMKRAEKIKAGDFVESEGKISLLDKKNSSFVINDLIIEYSGAAWAGGTADALRNGLTVEVQGDKAASGDALRATSLRIKKPGEKFGQNTIVSLEGFVSEFTSMAEFSLNGQKSSAENAECIEGKRDDIRSGVRIKANGKIDDKGVFRINRCRVKSANGLMVKAPVENVDITRNQITLLGTPYLFTADTQFRNEQNQNQGHFTLADLTPGDWITIKARHQDGQLVIAALSRIASEAAVTVEAPIADKSDSGVLTVLGMQVYTNKKTKIEPGTTLTINRVVRIIGSFENGVLVAKYIK